MKNNNGATIWSRKTLDSDIFIKKPDKWFKIWFYIVNTVNFRDDKDCQRGEGFFTYRQISDWTGATKHQIDAFFQWARQQGMQQTRKTTRGVFVSVLNYAKYQDLDFYKTDTETETKPKQNRNKTDTILEERKESKKVNIDIPTEYSEQTLSIVPVEETKALEKVDKRMPEIDIIIDTIKEFHGSIDGTQKENRRYGKLLKDKIDKIKGFNGDYKRFLLLILENSDIYSIGKTTSCKGLYYNLAGLITKIKTKFSVKETLII